MPSEEQFIQHLRSALRADQRTAPADLLQRIYRELGTGPGGPREDRGLIDRVRRPGPVSRRGRSALGAARAVRLGTVVPVLSGLLAILIAVAAITLLGHRSASSPSSSRHGISRSVSSLMRSLSPQQQREVLRYAMRIADTSLDGTRACAAARRARDPLQHGAPSAQLLSLLSVLRRPAHRADRLASLYVTGPSRIDGEYVHYIRLARTAFGARYYVIPAKTSGSVTRACVTAQKARDRRQTAQIPRPLRAAVLALALRSVRPPSREGVALLALGPDRSGWGFGPLTAREIEHGTSLQPTNPVIYGLVPDDVAVVQIDIPVHIKHGQHTVVMEIVNTRPIHNVFVVKHPKGFKGGRVTKVVWRAANGSIIRTLAP